MKRRFKDILNDCLERLSRGESLQDCLNAYPEQAKELASLLRVAQATQDVASAIAPRPEFKAQVLYHLNQRLAEGMPRRRLHWWAPAITRPVALAAAVVLLLVVGAGATTAAANSSVPGEPLYLVKTMRERVLLSMPRSEASRANLEADLASVRSEEMAVLASRGDSERVEDVAMRLNQHVEKAASGSVKGPAGGLSPGKDVHQIRERIKQNWQQQRKAFQEAIEKAPPGALPRMRKTMEDSANRFEAAVTLLGETNGVVMDVDATSQSIILKPRFGVPLNLAITGDTRVKIGGQEVSSAWIAQLQGQKAWVDYDPHTMEVREIRFDRPR